MDDERKDLQVAYITNTKEFLDYFNIFKKTAKTNSNPTTYCIGLDLEYFSVFNNPNIDYSGWIIGNTDNVACVLQMATESMVLVIHLALMGLPLPKKIFKILKSESWIKMGIGIDNDLNILSKCYNLGHCSGSIELRNIALLANVKNPSLGELYNRLGNFRISKLKSSSPQCWTKSLNDRLLKYCIYDAFMSYDLGIILLKPTIDHIKKPKLSLISNREKEIPSNQSNSSKEVSKQISYSNYVGQLQEISQTKNIVFPIFTSLSELYDNKPLHKVQCVWMDKLFESEFCKSKKMAKQNVCKIALDYYLNLSNTHSNN